MSPSSPAEAPAAVTRVVAALRARILDGELAPGDRLVERMIVEDHDCARHTARVALRTLQEEGLATVERNRGAHVAALDAQRLRGLFEVRTALELESAHRMLERHDGRVADEVHRAVADLDRVCARSSPPWRAIVEAHEGVHEALVRAGESERIAEAYARLSGELRLFVIALRPLWTPATMAEHHRRLLAALEREGPAALRRHLVEGEETVRRALG
ncbi:GntR family transcriptional regulator [Paraconexibacter sp.]|uniref:GntR family transcriptional regulator n=1 Tax=Paraconexibacter sp. TaxID=2949640 RepID=UPI003568551C